MQVQRVLIKDAHLVYSRPIRANILAVSFLHAKRNDPVEFSMWALQGEVVNGGHCLDAFLFFAVVYDSASIAYLRTDISEGSLSQKFEEAVLKRHGAYVIIAR